ncbi:type II toxin-antitoxin system VapC family toxin [soil metagenome]
MTSAVDTNVLVALLSGTEVEADIAQEALVQAASRGAVVICAAVYAELMAMPGLEAEDLDAFLKETDVVVDWSLEEAVWREAGLFYRRYAERRRSQKGDEGPRRILADFLIGAHASRSADRLLTLDPQLFKAFELEVVVPERA